jgi:protoporphyrinogen/coproporphyrinogen III oxidase
VDKDVRRMLLKPDAPKPRIVGVRVWPRAIPQFNVGHLDQLETAKQARAGFWADFG